MTTPAFVLKTSTCAVCGLEFSYHWRGAGLHVKRTCSRECLSELHSRNSQGRTGGRRRKGCPPEVAQRCAELLAGVVGAPGEASPPQPAHVVERIRREEQERTRRGGARRSPGQCEVCGAGLTSEVVTVHRPGQPSVVRVVLRCLRPPATRGSTRSQARRCPVVVVSERVLEGVAPLPAPPPPPEWRLARRADPAPALPPAPPLADLPQLPARERDLLAATWPPDATTERAPVAREEEPMARRTYRCVDCGCEATGAVTGRLPTRCPECRRARKTNQDLERHRRRARQQAEEHRPQGDLDEVRETPPDPTSPPPSPPSLLELAAQLLALPADEVDLVVRLVQAERARAH